jgi:hypothetical protein
VWHERGTIDAKWENWHDNFNTTKYPQTLVAYLKVKVQPDSVKSWTNNPQGSFMSGNSDRLFPEMFKGQPAPDFFVIPRTVDYSGFEPVVLLKDICDYNLKVFNNHVRPYV